MVSPFLSAMRILLSCFVFLMLVMTVQAEQVRIEVPVGDSPVFGPADAPVTIVEFIDFQ
jgi:protein-disulfide isomerase